MTVFERDGLRDFSMVGASDKKDALDGRCLRAELGEPPKLGDFACAANVGVRDGGLIGVSAMVSLASLSLSCQGHV